MNRSIKPYVGAIQSFLKYNDLPLGLIPQARGYVLREFFRKYANHMGFEHVNYMVGHTTRGSDSNHTSKDPEWYRDLYKEKAMSFLRPEAATPTEIEKTMENLKEQMTTKHQRLQELERK